MDMIAHVHDPLLIAGYWEQLLRNEWAEKRRQEDASERAKKSHLPFCASVCAHVCSRLSAQRSRYDMDCETEKEGSDHDDLGSKEQNKRKTTDASAKAFSD